MVESGSDFPLQVAVCRFSEQVQQQICILQPKLLTVCSINGEAASVPLPSLFTDIFPLDYGLLLTVRLTSCTAGSG